MQFKSLYWLSHHGMSHNYSFKIFPCFWLVKITRIIHHSQLLLTKFAKNFVYWTDDGKVWKPADTVINPCICSLMRHAVLANQSARCIEALLLSKVQNFKLLLKKIIVNSMNRNLLMISQLSSGKTSPLLSWMQTLNSILFYDQISQAIKHVQSKQTLLHNIKHTHDKNNQSRDK